MTTGYLSSWELYGNGRHGRGKEEQKINNLQLRATEAQFRHKYKNK